ncbi:prepilin-type N-terminal cleavage/methylation domain-containing protein [Candidatus Avelusimicrobium facis]|uniref:prepilin-type N-terminal cleavage/methylation domain-containing protein n=1 Tax=Candidatus Avelusimicrobium facis TaxID=3416203 RepID=UPI0015B6A000
MRKHGFTLTELLVVILIVGVLAAVAVPSYINAVNLSRLSTLLPTAKALKEAQERIYMASGKYTDTVTDLDLSAPGVKNGGKILNKTEQYVLTNQSEDSAAHNAITAENSKIPNNKLVVYLNHSPNFAGDVHCEALTSDKKALQLCTTQGGTQIGTKEQYTVFLLSGAGTGKLTSWPKQGECQKYAQYLNCARYTNEDGSWYESYDNNGILFEQYFDKDNQRYYAKQAHLNDGTVGEAWWENGVMTKQTKQYANGNMAEWGYDEKGIKNFFELKDSAGNMLQKATYDEKGKRTSYQWFENNNLRQVHSYDKDNKISGTTVYWSNNPGKVQFYNEYASDGSAVAQTKYWPDGSVRGYYTLASDAQSGIDSDGRIATEYNKDGSLRRSEDYSSPGYSSMIYEYSPDGTYIAKPPISTTTKGEGQPNPDPSTWTRGTYTVGTHGDVTRSDGVTVPGSGNFPKLCVSHPDQPQCAG